MNEFVCPGGCLMHGNRGVAHRVIMPDCSNGIRRKIRKNHQGLKVELDGETVVLRGRDFRRSDGTTIPVREVYMTNPKPFAAVATVKRIPPAKRRQLESS